MVTRGAKVDHEAGGYDDFANAVAGAVRLVADWAQPEVPTIYFGNYEDWYSGYRLVQARSIRMTADDLKDLGVGVVGHRRKLLNAIAALRADANTKVPLPDTLPTIDRSPKDAAERRHLIAVFPLRGS